MTLIEIQKDLDGWQVGDAWALATGDCSRRVVTLWVRALDTEVTERTSYNLVIIRW